MKSPGCRRPVKRIRNCSYFFLKTQPQALRKIQRAADRARYKRFFTTPLPRAAGIAVCLMLTLFLALGVAVASSKTVRVSLTKYVMNVGRDFASFRFEETGKYVDVPVEWEGQYYPSYLPEGLEVLSCSRTDVEYISADGRDMGFLEIDADSFGSVDTENASIEHVSIRVGAARFAPTASQKFFEFANKMPDSGNSIRRMCV